MVSLKHSMKPSREPDALVVLVHWLAQAFAYLPTPPALSLFNSAPDPLYLFSTLLQTKQNLDAVEAACHGSEQLDPMSWVLVCMKGTQNCLEFMGFVRVIEINYIYVSLQYS